MLTLTRYAIDITDVGGIGLVSRYPKVSARCAQLPLELTIRFIMNLLFLRMGALPTPVVGSAVGRYSIEASFDNQGVVRRFPALLSVATGSASETLVHYDKKYRPFPLC